MARYRKIDPRFWKDEKIIAFSPDEKLVALYLFTGQSNRIGLFSFSPGEAAEDVGMLPQTFGERFKNVCQTLNFSWDEKFRVLYLPTWWRYNQPENANNVIGNLKGLDDVPKSHLIDLFAENLEYLPENLRETFTQTLAKRYPQCYPKRSPSQEQEQEQEQNNKSGALAPRPSSSKKSSKGIPPEVQAQVNEIIGKINELSSLKFQADSKGTTAEIVRNLRERKSPADMILIAEYKWREWQGKDMQKHFTPTTLYRETHFDTYFAQAKATNGATSGGAPKFVELPAGHLELTANKMRISRADYERRWGKINLGDIDAKPEAGA